MDRSALKQQVVQHFPDEVREEFDMPFFRVLHESKIFNSRKIGAVSNHNLNSVSLYTLEQDLTGERARVPIYIVADGIHEHIHNFFNQKRYDVKDFDNKVIDLNRSHDLRSQALPDNVDHPGFGEDIITYSNSSAVYPHEFTFKPDIRGLERSTALTLKHDEVIDTFSDFKARAENEDRPCLERKLESDIDEILDSLDERKIKEYLRPVMQMDRLLDLDRKQKNRAKDEAMARFYVSTTLPEYAERRFENARTNMVASIGELNHENEDFSRRYIKALNEQYGQECASAFYQHTEKYRELIEEGYSSKQAADRILLDFLENIETISY